MYKELDEKHFKKHFNLPDDYKIEGYFQFGTSNSEKEIARLKRMLEFLKLKYEIKELSGFLRNIIEIKIENKIYWFAVVYGQTMSSEYIHLACLFGSNKNIHIGSCGGLKKGINSGDIIIPIFSHGNESTTRMYQPKIKSHKHFSNKDLSKNLETRIQNNFKVYSGSIISIQAMLAETSKDIKRWSKEKYLGVEMETATIFSVSNHFNIKSAAVLYITDNLIEGQIVGDASHEKEKEIREKTKDEICRIVIHELLEN